MSYESYLAHHGVKGMHWGVRRYQKQDGSLTEAGKRRGLVGKTKDAIGNAKASLSRSFETRRYRADRDVIASQHYKKHYAEEMDRLNTHRKASKEIHEKLFNEKDTPTLHKMAKDYDDKLTAQYYTKRDKYTKASREYANKQMVKKYGSEIVARMDKQEQRDAQVIATGLIVGFGAFAISNIKNGRL